MHRRRLAAAAVFVVAVALPAAAVATGGRARSAPPPAAAGTTAGRPVEALTTAATTAATDAAAPTTSPPDTVVAPPGATAAPAERQDSDRPIAIRLACEAVDGGIGCEWSEVDHPRAAGYRLWRAVDVPDPEQHRQVIFRTDDLGHTRHLDGDVRGGHTFHYAVEVVGHGGQSLAFSAPVRVELPPEPEPPQDLGLACEGVRGTDDHRPGIACRWAASTSPAFAAYRLIRSDGDARTIVFRTDDRAVTRFLDVEVRPGGGYAYVVEAVTADGRVVGTGGPARAVAPEPPEPQPLRLACALTATETERGIACEWSSSDAAGAAGYVLRRSVDGGEPIVIHRGGLDRTRYFDTEIRPGHRFTYVVAAVDAAGNPLARSEPVVVGVPG